MVAVTPNLSSFNRGELSPKLYSRTDTDAYFRGLRRCRNWIVENEGPVTFRGGTIFVAETHNNLPAFLYRFQFSDEQAYILEFTNNNFRVFRNLAIVLDGGPPLVVPTPYAAADLFQLKFAQNTTDLYVAHPTYNPQIITRTSDANWTITPQTPTGLTLGVNNYPAAVAFYEQRLVYGGSNNNPETLFFSKSADPNDFTTGTSADDGLQITLAATEDANRVEWMRGTEDFLAVGGFGDLLRVAGQNGSISADANSIPVVTPSNTFGVADINPVSGDELIIYTERNGRFLLTFEKDELVDIYRPVNRTEFAEHVTRSGIKQIAYQRGRPSVIWVLMNDGQLAGLTISRRQEVNAWHRHRTDGKFISIATSPLGEDGYDTLWLCVERVIDGVTKYYIEYMDAQIEFPLREDFELGEDEDADTATFQRSIQEFQKYPIHLDSSLSYDGRVRGQDAGANLTFSASTGENVTVTASASVFIAGDVGNEIWAGSQDGTRFGRAHIIGFISGTEVLVDILTDFDSTDVLSAGDWYITASTLSGLGHLEGKTVGIVTDGAIHPDRVVTSGSVTLDYESSFVHVGLRYTGVIETLDLEAGSRIGTAQTKPKNVTRVGIKMLNTLGLRYGDSFYDTENRLTRNATDLMDTPPPLFTGEEQLEFFNTDRNKNISGWSLEKRIVIVQDQPLPAQVQAIIPYFRLSDNL